MIILKNKLLIIIIFFVASLLPYKVDAENFSILSDSIKSKSAPKSAFIFLTTTDNITERYPAFIVPTPFESGKSDLPQWILGAKISESIEKKLDYYSVVLLEPDGRISFIPPKKWNEEKRRSANLSLDEMRVIINERRDESKKLDKTKEELLDQLARLQSDVDTISNIDRIVQVREDIAVKSESLEMAKKDIAILQNFLDQIKGLPLPRNYQQREAELTSQLVSLNELAKVSENLKNENGTGDESPTQRREAAIQAADLLDIEKLKEELSQLRKQRMRIEYEMQ